MFFFSIVRSSLYQLVTDPRIVRGYFFFMIVLLFEIFLNVLVLKLHYIYKQYIVRFMMIEGIVLKLDVERIEL